MAYRATEKTEARKRAQHDLLLRSALKVVVHHGFQGLTIQAVSEEAEVATGTVYKYFENKAELCTEVFKLASQKEVDMVRSASAADGKSTCAQRLANAMRQFAERAILGHKLAYALIAEPVDPMVESARLVYRREYAGIFADLVNEGIEKKEFRKQDAQVAATGIVGLLSETLIGPLSGINSANDSDFDENAFIEEVTRFCLSAVKA